MAIKPEGFGLKLQQNVNAQRPGMFERRITLSTGKIISVVCFVNTYPLDIDLSGGERYPAFEQTWPVRSQL